MKFEEKARRAGLDDGEIRDLKLLAQALGIRIRSVEVISEEQQVPPERKKVFNYDE